MAKGNSDASAVKMIPADCVSVLLMAIGSTSISKAQYDMMSALDGTRTASSFDHQFRSIIQKAKDLKVRVDNGEKFVPVMSAKKRGAVDMSSPRDTTSSPSKKPKATPKPRAKKTGKASPATKDATPGEAKGSPPSPTSSDFQSADDIFASIENETLWDGGYV